MKFLKIIERFFPKTFVGIWLKNGIYKMSIKKVLPSGRSNLESKEFDQDAEEDKMFQFLLEIQKSNIVTYIAHLDSSDFQGAIPITDKQEYLYFSEINTYKDFEDILFKPQLKNWTLFTLQSDLIHTQNKLKTVGLDFIFSPFLFPIIVQDKYKLSKNTSIFIIAEGNLTIFTIFKDDKLLFGRFITDVDMNAIVIEESQNELENDKIANFNNLSTDIESSDKFKNQNDSLFFNEDIEEVNNSSQDQEVDIDLMLDLEGDELKVEGINLDKSDIQPEQNIAELERFLKEDLKDEELEQQKIQEDLDINYNFIYQVIRNDVHEFYTNNQFASNFIENCYILTSLKISNSFIQKIEDEFSFDTERVRIDISELLIDLIGEELG